MSQCPRRPIALVADLLPHRLAVYIDVLSARGYAIHFADSGADALAKAVSEPPDLIIVSTDLPLIDGFALCALLRRDAATRGLPIVLVADDPADDRARLAGASLVLAGHALRDELEAQADRVRPISVSESKAVQGPPSDWRGVVWCPRCNQGLVLLASHVGGVSRRRERWDDLMCPACSDRYEYRERTRTLRQVPNPEPAHWPTRA